MSAVSSRERSKTTKSPEVVGKRRAVPATRTFTDALPTKSGSVPFPIACASDEEAMTGIGPLSVGCAGRSRKTWSWVSR